jgi:hypothetical protein
MDEQDSKESNALDGQGSERLEPRVRRIVRMSSSIPGQASIQDERASAPPAVPPAALPAGPNAAQPVVTAQSVATAKPVDARQAETDRRVRRTVSTDGRATIDARAPRPPAESAVHARPAADRSSMDGGSLFPRPPRNRGGDGLRRSSRPAERPAGSSPSTVGTAERAAKVNISHAPQLPLSEPAPPPEPVPVASENTGTAAVGAIVFQPRASGGHKKQKAALTPREAMARRAMERSRTQAQRGGQSVKATPAGGSPSEGSPKAVKQARLSAKAANGSESKSLQLAVADKPSLWSRIVAWFRGLLGAR